VTGQAAAAAVLNARQNDHAFGSRLVHTALGARRVPVHPGLQLDQYLGAGLGVTSRRFTVSGPDYFPTATRPAVTDPEWLASLNEVRGLRRVEPRQCVPPSRRRSAWSTSRGQ